MFNDWMQIIYIFISLKIYHSFGLDMNCSLLFLKHRHNKLLWSIVTVQHWGIRNLFVSPSDSVPRPGVISIVVVSVLIFEKSPPRFSYSATPLSSFLLYPCLPVLPASGDRHSLYLKAENNVLTLKRREALAFAILSLAQVFHIMFPAASCLCNAFEDLCKVSSLSNVPWTWLHSMKLIRNVKGPT